MNLIEHHEDPELLENYETPVSPSGSWRHGYSTWTEPTNTPMAEGIKDLIAKSALELTYYKVLHHLEQHDEIQITTHSCWSGYSEYTITSEWNEIEIVWGDYRLYFESMTEFFKAVSDTYEGKERSY